MKVFVASKFENYERVIWFQDKLKIGGVEIAYDWATCLANGVEEDAKLQCQSEACAICDSLDCLVLILPRGRGSHVEFGMAWAMRVPIVVYSADSNDLIAFHYLKGVEIYGDMTSVLAATLRNCYDENSKAA